LHEVEHQQQTPTNKHIAWTWRRTSNFLTHIIHNIWNKQKEIMKQKVDERMQKFIAYELRCTCTLENNEKSNCNSKQYQRKLQIEIVVNKHEQTTRKI